MSTNAIETLARFAPLAALSLLLASSAAKGQLQKRAGIPTWVLPADDSLEGWIGRFMRLLAAGWALRALWQAIFPVAPTLPSALLPISGSALLVVGVVMAVAGQWSMGGSWRVGIPAAAPPALVTSGLFSCSRNPVFLGMLFATLGGTAIMQDAASTALFAATFAAINVQVRMEELHLGDRLGEAYAAYRRATPRWCGPIFR